MSLEAVLGSGLDGDTSASFWYISLINSSRCLQGKKLRLAFLENVFMKCIAQQKRVVFWHADIKVAEVSLDTFKEYIIGEQKQESIPRISKLCLYPISVSKAMKKYA